MSTTNDGRSEPPGGRPVASGASSAAARGAALIALAVVIGIILLQIVDDGSSGPVATDDTTPAETTTTTAPSSDEDGEASTTTAAVVDTPERALEEVRVLVLNAGGPGGSAGTMSDALSSVGYVNQPVSATNDDTEIEGNAVMCVEGFEREADTLAIAVGPGTVVLPFRDPPPANSEDADCVVLVGAQPTG